MKKLFIILASLLVVTSIVFLTTGPFNLYHYINAEKIVKESGLFQPEEGSLDDLYYARTNEITDVDYLGRSSYLVTITRGENEEQLILRINNKSTRIQTEIFTYDKTRNMMTGY
ncbi:hypothetical protein LGQ02_10245 [Bacillus shivajii]|uniref:hypothetical protein n=1 Tax=Bacillus shivajii TaxID=1983719 RepID=UPI001CFB0686|nr:hypothetical protein [Bacillus shivajii]UCZ55072.1 hypothetical protein LGQ02_10245 [Bacillus shivajii]